jgi:hypothetical protein
MVVVSPSVETVSPSRRAGGSTALVCNLGAKSRNYAESRFIPVFRGLSMIVGNRFTCRCRFFDHHMNYCMHGLAPPGGGTRRFGRFAAAPDVR